MFKPDQATTVSVSLHTCVTEAKAKGALLQVSRQAREAEEE